MICARLAELDPEAALKRLGEEEPDATWLARMTVLTEWALLDSDAAWAFIPTGKEGDQDRSNITGMLLHEDRELFMQWFRRVRQPMPDGDPAWLLVAERYPAELQEIADDLLKKMEAPTDGMQFDFAPLFQLLAKNRAAKDPAAALEWAKQLAPSVRGYALHAVLEAWVAKDPQAVWKQISTAASGIGEKDLVGLQREKISKRILTAIARDDPAAAMKMILDPECTVDIFDLGSIDAMTDTVGPAMASGKMDPVEAYRLLNSAKGSDSNLQLNVFMRVWASLPPERLAVAARGILAEPADRMKSNALSGIASAWMQSDPSAATAFISGIEDKDLRHEIFAGAFQRATGSNVEGPEQAAILQQIPAADRAGVFNSFTSGYGEPTPGQHPFHSGRAGIQPELIATQLTDLPPSSDLTRAAKLTALKWGELDPTAALAWADGLADPAARTSAYAGAFDGWVYHDPYSAAAWLVEKPAGPERDAATLPLVHRLGDSDPARAWEWAGAIGEASLQTNARLAALKAWSNQSPEEARAAYQDYTATLSPADAAKFAERYSAK